MRPIIQDKLRTKKSVDFGCGKSKNAKLFLAREPVDFIYYLNVFQHTEEIDQHGYKI